MKTKNRAKSNNIEDRRPGKIKSTVKGLPLGSMFTKVYPMGLDPNGTKYKQKRGRKLKIRPDKLIMSNRRQTGGYR